MKLLPRFIRHGWFGSVPTGRGDDDAEGIALAVSWFGFSIELVLAREDRAPPPLTGKELR